MSARKSPIPRMRSWKKLSWTKEYIVQMYSAHGGGCNMLQRLLGPMYTKVLAPRTARGRAMMITCLFANVPHTVFHTSKCNIKEITLTLPDLGLCT